MARSKAATVTEYLRALPDDQRKVIAKVRSVIRKHLPKSCVRFNSVDDLPLPAIAQLVARVLPDKWIARAKDARKR